MSSTKQVQFSQGNLQAYFSSAGTSCTWRFATNQYDIVGNNAANTNAIGSGLSLIEGNHRTDLKVEMVWRL